MSALKCFCLSFISFMVFVLMSTCFIHQQNSLINVINCQCQCDSLQIIKFNQFNYLSISSELSHLFTALSLYFCICFIFIIMILNNFKKIASLRRISKVLFSKQSISASRIQQIKHHTLHTEYQGLNPAQANHLQNTWRIIQDQTKLKFLIEEGGFPGCSDIGILLKVGTQNETQKNAGSLFCLRNLVHMKPDFSDSIKNYQFLNQTGSTVDFSYDVQSTYIKCSFFEEDNDIMVNLLLDLALRQKKLFQQTFQTEGEIPEIVEQTRVTAFKGVGVGMPSNGLGQILTNKDFIDFQKKHITPHDTVISLSNVKNPEKVIAEIKKKIKDRYPQFLSRSAPAPVTSKYYGGIQKIQSQSQFFEMSVSYPGCHAKSSKMELYNILRVLLGSASSFSSGGPGKGMHSRCTKNLLNKIGCIQSASYLLSHYQNFGLFGMTASGPNVDAEEVTSVTLEQLSKLKTLIPEIELERAKNILIASIYSNIERQSDRLEQLTKHINTYGRIKIQQFQGNIRAVTSEDIRKQILSVFSSKPTFVIKGNKKSQKIADNLKQIYKL